MDELSVELRMKEEARKRMEDERGTRQLAVCALEGQLLCSQNSTKAIAAHVLDAHRSRAKEAQTAFEAETELHAKTIARLQAQVAEMNAHTGPLATLSGFWGRTWGGAAGKKDKEDSGDEA